MEKHPSYDILSSLAAKYPRASGCLFLAYNDIVYSQQWSHVELLDLEPCSRAAIRGRRPNTEVDVHAIPCSLSELLSFKWLSDAFAFLSDPSEVYLAISSDDSSIVYYKISQGIVKPPL